METGITVPKNLLSAVNQLREKIYYALLGDEEQLEETFTAMFPDVWKLRISALPFLADLKVSEALHQIEVDLEVISTKFIQLKPTAERLQFGFELMNQIVLNHDDSLIHMSEIEIDSIPNYPELINQIKKEENEHSVKVLSILHGSMMMEILLFAIIQYSEKNTQPPEFAMCHELQYLASVATKQYAEGWGINETTLPWYEPSSSDFQDFLISGPVATSNHIQSIKDKRAHFNTWK